MARQRIITLLMPLPTYCNPDASADLPDTEETREWVKSYARTKLITRFQQDAIYLRWLSVETELVRPLERVTGNEEE